MSCCSPLIRDCRALRRNEGGRIAQRLGAPSNECETIGVQSQTKRASAREVKDTSRCCVASFAWRPQAVSATVRPMRPHRESSRPQRHASGSVIRSAAHVSRLCRPLDCRRDAAETPRHGPIRLTTAQHRALADTWTEQHNRGRRTTRQTICPGFLNLVSAVRSSPGAPRNSCSGRSREAYPCPDPCERAVGADKCRRAGPLTTT